MGIITSFFKAAKSLGGSAIVCIIKGIVGGLITSLVLTLLLFYWGETVLGLKYIFGFLFFVASGVMISIYTCLKGLLKLVDGAVDSAVSTTTNAVMGLMGDKADLLNPEIQFDRVKTLVSDRCPAVAPLLGMVNYSQLMSLAKKSKYFKTANAFVSDKVGKVQDTSMQLMSMTNALKLVWHVPVGSFMNKIFVAVAVTSIVILAVRLILL